MSADTRAVAAYGSAPRQSIEVAGQTFTSLSDLMETLQSWSASLDQRRYLMRFNQAVEAVSEVVRGFDNTNTQILIQIYELGRSTIKDFNKFKKSSDYRVIWGRVDEAVDWAKRNKVSVEKARARIVDLWADEGEKFLRINSAQGWVKAVANLANKVHDAIADGRMSGRNYSNSTALIRNAIWTRINEVRRGSSLALNPGLVDIQMALGYVKSSPIPDPIPPAVFAELDLEIDEAGLLQPRSSQAQITDVTGAASEEELSFGIPRKALPEPPSSPGAENDLPGGCDALEAESEAQSSVNDIVQSSPSRDTGPQSSVVRMSGGLSVAAGRGNGSESLIEPLAGGGSGIVEQDSGGNVRDVTPEGDRTNPRQPENRGNKRSAQETESLRRRIRARHADQAIQGQQRQTSTSEVACRPDQPSQPDEPNQPDQRNPQNQARQQRQRIQIGPTPRGGTTRPTPRARRVARGDSPSTTTIGGSVHGDRDETVGQESLQEEDSRTPQDTEVGEGQNNGAESLAARLVSTEHPELLEDLLRRLNCYNMDTSGGQKNIVLTNILSWWRSPIPLANNKTIAELAAAEAKIFHLRHGTTDLHFSHYSLTQQLLESDPVLWLLNSVLHDGATELVAFPQPMETTTGSPGGSDEWADHFQFSNKLGRTAIQFDGRTYLPTLRPVESRDGVTKLKGLGGNIETVKRMRAEFLPTTTNFHTQAVRQHDVSRHAVRIPLEGLSPLSDAVLSLRGYKDPKVQAEIDIILGHNRETAWHWIQIWRLTATTKYVQHLGILARLELSRRAHWPESLAGRVELEHILMEMARGTCDFT